MSSKHFCLKWNSYQANILNAFESLQSTEDLTDVTLTCEGINLKAHKIILSACSPYFRTVFKENPCSHPIVILKDVSYTDLIAIIKFMYQGEVFISEDQLPSFLQTAKLLQISGLNSSNETYNKHIGMPIMKKSKVATKLTDIPEPPMKKMKGAGTAIKSKISKMTSIPNASTSNENLVTNTLEKRDADAHSESPKNFEVVEVDKIKTEEEVDEGRDICQPDINENVEVIVSEKSQQQSSILEAALEIRDPKPSSILERSLTSQHIPTSGKSPLAIQFPIEQINVIPSIPDLTKIIVTPRKPADQDLEKRSTKSHSSDSNPPFDRPADLLLQSIKIEGELCDNVEVLTTDDALQRDIAQFSRDINPHHSSLCGYCPHCGQLYSNQSALKYHVRLVHSDLTNMYCCHLCPESFDYREGYKKHMADVHCIRN